MKIVWFSWKDRGHPLAGGAESVSGKIMDNLVKDGHEVKLVTALYKGSVSRESVGGIDIYRSGNRYSVYLKAKSIFQNELSGWADIVIDEMNTIPFGTGFYSRSNNILLCYQLAREVWFHQMVFPLSLVGYISEPFILRKLAKAYLTAITESTSTKIDMEKYSFKNVNVFRVGMALTPLESLSPKKNDNIVLSLGAIRPMKRTLHAVKAFEVARDKNRDLTMIIAGDNKGSYADKVTKYISKSRHSSSIKILGRVSSEQKLDLMQQASVILVTSVKEGWGLIITEANSQGTPAIAYNVDGLRDSIKNNVTGLLAPDSDFRTMGDEIIRLLSDRALYESLRQEAWQFSKEFTFENSYRDFIKIISNNSTMLI